MKPVKDQDLQLEAKPRSDLSFKRDKFSFPWQNLTDHQNSPLQKSSINHPRQTHDPISQSRVDLIENDQDLNKQDSQPVVIVNPPMVTKKKTSNHMSEDMVKKEKQHEAKIQEEERGNWVTRIWRRCLEGVSDNCGCLAMCFKKQENPKLQPSQKIRDFNQSNIQQPISFGLKPKSPSSPIQPSTPSKPISHNSHNSHNSLKQLLSPDSYAFPLRQLQRQPPHIFQQSDVVIEDEILRTTHLGEKIGRKDLVREGSCNEDEARSELRLIELRNQERLRSLGDVEEERESSLDQQGLDQELRIQLTNFEQYSPRVVPFSLENYGVQEAYDGDPSQLYLSKKPIPNNKFGHDLLGATRPTNDVRTSKNKTQITSSAGHYPSIKSSNPNRNGLQINEQHRYLTEHLDKFDNLKHQTEKQPQQPIKNDQQHRQCAKQYKTSSKPSNPSNQQGGKSSNNNNNDKQKSIDKNKNNNQKKRGKKDDKKKKQSTNEKGLSKHKCRCNKGNSCLIKKCKCFKKGMYCTTQCGCIGCINNQGFPQGPSHEKRKTVQNILRDLQSSQQEEESIVQSKSGFQSLNYPIRKADQIDYSSSQSDESSQSQQGILSDKQIDQLEKLDDSCQSIEKVEHKMPQDQANHQQLKDDIKIRSSTELQKKIHNLDLLQELLAQQHISSNISCQKNDNKQPSQHHSMKNQHCANNMLQEKSDEQNEQEMHQVFGNVQQESTDQSTPETQTNGQIIRQIGREVTATTGLNVQQLTKMQEQTIYVQYFLCNGNKEIQGRHCLQSFAQTVQTLPAL